MFHDPVGDTQYFHVCLVVMCCHEFEDGAAEAANNSTVFNGHDLVVLAEHFMQQCFIEGLHESDIVVGRVDAFGVGVVPETDEGQGSGAAQ